MITGTMSRLFHFKYESNDFNQVFGGVLGGLGILRHVVPDMILHELAHQTVDGAPGRGEALKNMSAWSSAFRARSTPSSCPTTFLVRFNKSNFSRLV